MCFYEIVERGLMYQLQLVSIQINNYVIHVLLVVGLWESSFLNRLSRRPFVGSKWDVSKEVDVSRLNGFECGEGSPWD